MKKLFENENESTENLFLNENKKNVLYTDSHNFIVSIWTDIELLFKNSTIAQSQF